MARRHEHRPSGFAERLGDEVPGVAGDVVVLEEVPATGDHVDGFVAGSRNDPVQRATEIVAASLRPDAEEALARKRSVQMEVGKME